LRPGGAICLGGACSGRCGRGEMDEWMVQQLLLLGDGRDSGDALA